MAIQTKFSGRLIRFDGDDVERQYPYSVTKTVTEGASGRIAVAPGSTNLSIMPLGLAKATVLFIEKITSAGVLNVEITGQSTASLDIISDGVFALAGSLSDVKVSNREATPTINVFYDVSG